MKLHRHFLCVLCASAFSLLLLSSGSCATERTEIFPARAMVTGAATQPAREFHLHLNGIGGFRDIDRELIGGLRDGGYHGHITAYDWTGRDVGLAALTVKRRHAEQAKKVAEMLLAELSAHPTSRITITAHSAGAGIITWALEQLPDGAMVDSIVMLAPALSPTYDLSRALRHVRGNVYVFFSPHDATVLGLGTRMLGTVDGKKVDASGRVGFKRPPRGDETLYMKLIPVPYRTAWAKLGNIGDHIGALERRFVAMVLAPVLLRGELPAEPGEDPLMAPPAPATAPIAGAKPPPAPARPDPMP